MTKVKLIGTPQTQWNIGNSFYAGGTVMDLSDDLVKKHKDVCITVVDESNTVKVVKELKPKKVSKKKVK